MKKFYVGLITFLVMLLVIIIQINLINSLPLWGIVANIGICMISAFGISAGKFVGGIVGFFYGLFIDLLFSRVLRTIYNSIPNYRSGFWICKNNYFKRQQTIAYYNGGY